MSETWIILSGRFSMTFGSESTDIVDRELRIGYRAARHMSHGRWQMADGRWQMAEVKNPKSKVPAHPADENIVRGVCSHRDTETANDEDPGEEHARHPPEYEGVPGECLTRRTGVMCQREE